MYYTCTYRCFHKGRFDKTIGGNYDSITRGVSYKGGSEGTRRREVFIIAFNGN